MDSQQVLTIAGGGLLTLLIVCGPIMLVEYIQRTLLAIPTAVG